MVESMIHDYYNELPTTVRIINEMNEELEDIRKEKDNEIAELKKEHHKLVERVFEHFRNEPDNEIMKEILEKPHYRDDPFIFKCSECECIADERYIFYEDLTHYISYLSDNNTENKLCYDCFYDGYTEFYNQIISKHFNIECNQTIYTNEHTKKTDLGILLILLAIAKSENKDKYNDLNKLVGDYFELTYDWDGDGHCGLKYPDNHEEAREEENFITNFKKLLKEICDNAALISDSRNFNYYKLLYTIIPHNLDPNESDDIIFNKLIKSWKICSV